MREGTMACTACHSPHGSTAPAQLVKNTVNETCTGCHAEYRGPYLWEDHVGLSGSNTVAFRANYRDCCR